MITLEEAYEYFNNERLFSDVWIMSEESKQIQSLKMAENQIKTLKFNKYEDEYRSSVFKKAICEQALHLLENNQRQKLINQGVTSFSVEGLSETYDNSKANTICVEARMFLKPYLLGCVPIC